MAGFRVGYEGGSGGGSQTEIDVRRLHLLLIRSPGCHWVQPVSQRLSTPLSDPLLLSPALSISLLPLSLPPSRPSIFLLLFSLWIVNFPRTSALIGQLAHLLNYLNAVNRRSFGAGFRRSATQMSLQCRSSCRRLKLFKYEALNIHCWRLFHFSTTFKSLFQHLNLFSGYAKFSTYIHYYNIIIPTTRDAKTSGKG